MWAVIRAVHVSHLSVYPNDLHARLNYALAAEEARQWTVAAGQYAAIGDDPPGWLYHDLAAYHAKKEAEENARKPAPAKP